MPNDLHNLANASQSLRDAFQKDSENLEQLEKQLLTIPHGIQNPEWVIKRLEMLERIDQSWREVAERGIHPQDETRLYYRAFSKRWGDDTTTQAGLQEILDHHEWITIPKFGAKANKTALSIVIHADHDRAFQEKIIKLLEEKYMDSELSDLRGHAYLFDRICFTHRDIEAAAIWDTGLIPELSRPQRYASQGQNMIDGIWQPLQIEDLAHVDERRNAVGLTSLREYFNRMNSKILDIDSYPIVPIPLNAPAIYK